MSDALRRVLAERARRAGARGKADQGLRERGRERQRIPKRGQEGYSAPYRSQPRNVTIRGERAIKEHVLPGDNLRQLTRDPTTGRSDYVARTKKGRPGTHYRKDVTVLARGRVGNRKTNESGRTPSDRRRIADVRRKQAAAARGRGQGAHLNRDVVVPSYKRAVEAGMKAQHAARGILGQLGNLFGIQRLDESGRKVQQHADRLAGRKGDAALRGRSGVRPKEQPRPEATTVKPEAPKNFLGRVRAGARIVGGRAMGAAGAFANVGTVKELADAMKGVPAEINVEGIKAKDYPIGHKIEGIEIGTDPATGNPRSVDVEVMKDSYGRKIFAARRITTFI